MRTDSRTAGAPPGSAPLGGSARSCVICGARVRNQNPKTTTCDETCTAARNAGRTRVEQIQWELANPNVNENPPCCETCGMFTSQCQCWDAVNGVD